MSFLRNNLTCASLTMEPHLAPRDFRAARTATSGQFNCRQQADLIVVDQSAAFCACDAAITTMRLSPRSFATNQQESITTWSKLGRLWAERGNTSYRRGFTAHHF
jgi:hypothetical protein